MQTQKNSTFCFFISFINQNSKNALLEPESLTFHAKAFEFF